MISEIKLYINFDTIKSYNAFKINYISMSESGAFVAEKITYFPQKNEQIEKQRSNTLSIY
jgi:hypothetical protein